MKSVVLLLSLLLQSQATDGVIEGLVLDPSGAVVANATVKVTNLDTGYWRTLTTGASGVYRASLLPLGRYEVAVEAQGFKRAVRSGVTLTAGKTAVVDFNLEIGQVEQTITVTSDIPIADTGKIQQGGTITAQEVRNLPLVSRNIYNYMLLQPAVSARPNNEFGVPRKINVNGFIDRVNYQLDGNTNTQADRAGIRLMPISEVYVREVQVVNNGFAAEFGTTTGTVYNAITDSGTNELHGEAGYRLRRKSFSARPSLLSPTTPKPEFAADTVTGRLGGPVFRDELHYFGAYEFTRRDIPRPITVTPANAARIGLQPSQIGVVPASQRVNFFIARTDYTISEAHRLMSRYNFFRNTSPNNIGGALTAGLLSLTRSTDFKDSVDAVAAQLTSSLSSGSVNEFRFQYANRRNSRVRNSENAARGPAITISGIAQFGGPTDDGQRFRQTGIDVVDNFTLLRGNHALKFGFSLTSYTDFRGDPLFAEYTFPTIDSYLAAVNGTNRKGYSTFRQSIGDPEIQERAYFYSFFVQDEWRVRQNVKLNYGVRYEVYDIPNPNSAAPLSISRNFNVDKNNFAPRVGVSYGLGQERKTVIRASAGMYYDFPKLDFYRLALLNNGSPRFRTVSVAGTSALAPSFPQTLETLPPGFPLPSVSINAVASDFANLYSTNANVQVERALTNDLGVTVSYVFAKGTHIPIQRNINPINPVRRLADGRPVFDTTVNPQTRLFPGFDNVFLAESVGNSNYNGLTAQLIKRFSHGYQFTMSYTWAHAIDDAPEVNVLDSNLQLSDPTNRRRDRGNGISDRRHIFYTSSVLAPKIKLENRGLNALLNDNQFAFIVSADSGDTFNVLANRDLNNDRISTDRPLFIGRNTVDGPNTFNWDVRYSRFFRVSERANIEAFAEFVNLTNHPNITEINATLGVNTDGSLVSTIPTRFPRTGALESRQFQLGFKFNF
jgi:hypothetical protein